MIFEVLLLLLSVSYISTQGVGEGDLSESQFGSLFKDTSGGGGGQGGSIAIEGGNNNNPLANIDDLVGRDNNPQTGGLGNTGAGNQSNAGGNSGGTTTVGGGGGTSVFGDFFSNTAGGDNIGRESSTIGGGVTGSKKNTSTSTIGSTTSGGRNTGGSRRNTSSSSSVNVNTVVDNSTAGRKIGNTLPGGTTNTGGSDTVTNNPNLGTGTGSRNNRPVVEIGGALPGSTNVQTDPAAKAAHTWRHDQTHSRKKELWTPEAKAFCAENCVNVDQNHCNFGHENTCYYFYHCYNGPSWGLVHEVCAFGSYYNATAKQCDHVRNVNCQFEKCGTLTESAMYPWDENDKCNRAYWQCIAGGQNELMSSPRCCGPKERFDPATATCVPSQCREPCPLNPNERCRIEEKFDFLFAYNFTNCREYFKCESDSTAIRQCCPEFERFSEALGKCVPDSTCEDNCLIEEECPFKPVNTGKPEDIYFYMNGGIKQLCAYGTVFKQQEDGTGCYRCLKDENGQLMPECMNKVNITFTTSEWNLNTQFSNHAAGTHEFKMVRRNGGFGKFNTRAIVKIENYHATGNAFKKGFYTNITFQHEPKGDPEVLMSTCTPVMDSTPSLHIVLSNQNVVATIITDTKLTTLTVPYEPNQINNLIFDVQTFLGSIHTITLTVTPENPVAGKSYTKTESGEFGTAIKENGPGESPLSIGGCERNGNVIEGFNGLIYNVKIFECNEKAADVNV